MRKLLELSALESPLRSVVELDVVDVDKDDKLKFKASQEPKFAET